MHSSDKSSYYDSDKIEPHGYFQAYTRIAAKLGPKARVCELGVEAGESLRIFQGLFPLGEIIGVDHDRNAIWPEGTVKIVMEQDDRELPDEVGGRLDLVVDDASHDGQLSQRSWVLLWPLVQPGGYYVVEDWQVSLRSDPAWGSACWGPSMLKLAESFLPLLDRRDGMIEEIIYRYGLIILRKSRSAS